MRIREPYKKFGFFCFADDPENEIPGILSVRDGGKAQLEVFSLHRIFSLYRSVNKNPQHIIGTAEGQGQVTLSNCRCYSECHRRGIYKYIFQAKKTFVGCQYKENEKNQFNAFYFSVEGLHKWIPRNWAGAQLASIAYKMDNNISLSFQYAEETRLEDNINCLTEHITQKACCKIFSKEAQDLDKFISISQKITQFLCFVMNDIVCIDEPVQITSDKMQKELSNKTKIPVYVKLYYPSRPFIKNSPEDIQPLFMFKLIEHNMEQTINNWIKIYNTTHPALELYFSTQTGENRFLDARFLTLIQSIEAYQQRVSRKRLQTIESLTQFIRPFEKWISDKNALIEKVINARNYFTHYNPKTEETEKKKIYEKLPALYLKLETVFQMTLLKALGFDDAKIKSIMLNNIKSSRGFELLNETSKAGENKLQ